MKAPKKAVIMIGCIILFPGSATLSYADSNQTYYLSNCLIIDGTGAEPISNGVIIIENEKIKAVGIGESLEPEIYFDFIKKKKITEHGFGNLGLDCIGYTGCRRDISLDR